MRMRMRMRTIDDDIDDEENYQGMKGEDDCGDDTHDEMHQDTMKNMYDEIDSNNEYNYCIMRTVIE